jgi:hypothetical protein
MPFVLPPLVAAALAIAGGAILGRLIKREWQRVNAELHPQRSRNDDVTDRDRMPKLKPDPETGIYRAE